MNVKIKILFSILMITALVFGFIHVYFPADNYSFERLHIFLFNLCTGGTILLYYTQARVRVSKTVGFFFFGSLIYAFSAFLKLYPLTILVSVLLFVLVEKIRIEKFSLFPILFFRPKEPVSEKFHQASLLCLSCGLFMASLVILNNEYFKIVTMEKLTLNTFFLGFSFPLSLITMSVMFSLMKEDVGALVSYLKNLGFWNVNLGVIIFFLFILFEMLIPQIVVTAILFFSVVMIFLLFRNLGIRVQQKYFLTSGIVFLLYTAVTGILSIVLEFNPVYTHEKMKVLLRMHSFASLYGWNLSGLAVICRKDEFPLVLHSTPIIVLHWITAILLAPLGTYYRPFAILALMGYGVILYFIMFSQKGIGDSKIEK